MTPIALSCSRLGRHAAAAALMLLGAASMQAADAADAVAGSVKPGHLKLVDALDRPQDGYCLDIVGSGRYIRFDLPLTAHNCKPGLYADEAVVLQGDGRIHFPAYDKCVTAAGLNGRALPGAGLVARDCGERTPFLDAPELQAFRFHEDGRVELAGSGLCLTAGPESAATFSDEHRWRALYLERCERAEPARSRWQFSIPIAAQP